MLGATAFQSKTRTLADTNHFFFSQGNHNSNAGFFLSGRKTDQPPGVYSSTLAPFYLFDVRHYIA
jgi:hypothetical protein